MEMSSERLDEPSFFARGWGSIKALSEKSLAVVVEVARQTKKVAKDDTRRVIHSFKVGLALSLVSLFYYFKPLYDNFGVSAMWAIITVVVVLEFSVGATIGKGLNRGLATVVAGALGIGAHHLASNGGKIGEPILLGLFVFLQAMGSTFARFFPNVKARYDYGMIVFILTFCLVSISSFRSDEILEVARKRISTILIGASVCVIVSIVVCPVWAGEDLHSLVAQNLDKLGTFLEGFGDEYFKKFDEKEWSRVGKTVTVDYKSALNSKATEETLANFARWEPAHGNFQFFHPWKQYLKIGRLIQQCACRIEALNGYITSQTEVQAPQQISEKIQETSAKMSLESGRALKELAFSIRTMTKSSSAHQRIISSREAANNLKLLLRLGFWEHINLLQIIPVAAVASILTDIVTSVEDISEAVNELAVLAKFKVAEENETSFSSLESKSCAQQNLDKNVDSARVVALV